ncbi:DUF6965 family protein [Paraflavitalea pollutisoli]|uniref:DUF6965 family protein n=1 Tax=Paraflavitalea pollutisoli TaxID=3034143 RepID=UPI0023ED51D7|nr:hypothetical protein [Paraflavitalea sp. H1-2-19X]
MNEAIAPQVEELKAFFQQHTLPKTAQLSTAELIIDLPLFLDSHFTMLETQDDARNYEVFLLRLIKLQEIIQAQA